MSLFQFSSHMLHLFCLFAPICFLFSLTFFSLVLSSPMPMPLPPLCFLFYFIFFVLPHPKPLLPFPQPMPPNPSTLHYSLWLNPQSQTQPLIFFLWPNPLFSLWPNPKTQSWNPYSHLKTEDSREGIRLPFGSDWSSIGINNGLLGFGLG